jgi:hypothetical protein
LLSRSILLVADEPQFTLCYRDSDTGEPRSERLTGAQVERIMISCGMPDPEIVISDEDDDDDL